MIGQFSVGHSLSRCNNASSRPSLCSWSEFEFNCPQTCNACKSRDCTGDDPDCCGGLTNTCALRIDEIFFAAMHNANNDENHWNSNHKAPLEEALEAGFRAFYLDVCICHGEVVFCHGNCYWAGEQDPVETISNIVSFLKENPTELIIFNFEMSHGNPTPLQLVSLLHKVNGFKSRTYVHRGGYWPTLGSLLQDGKQIISFKHNGINCVSTSNSGCTPYIQEFFKFTVGTRYDFDNINVKKPHNI